MLMRSKSLLFKVAVSLVLGLGSSASAGKTLVWLTDWYQGNLDSVNVTSVSIPHYTDSGAQPSGYWYGTKDLELARTGAYAPPIRVNLKVDNTGKPDSLKVPKEMSRWWYAQPDFNSGNFNGGMLNVMLKFQSFNHTVTWNGSVQVGTGTGSGQSGQLNQYNNGPGFIDSCVGAINADSVWIYAPAPDSVINPGYIGNGFKCVDHNPFFVKVGTVHVYNPWPGKNMWVQVGATWFPLYSEKGRNGWQVATIWGDPRAVPAFKVRVASGKPGTAGVQYLDMNGLGTVANGPVFDFSASPGSEQWIMPPTVDGGRPTVATAAPPISTVLMIQRPTWGVSALRVVWKGNTSRFIAASTAYCNWFSLPLYAGAVPDSILLQHPKTDTVYGSRGMEVAPANAADIHWISLKGKVAAGDTTWITTPPLVSGASIVARPANLLTMCNEKILAFSAYDYGMGDTARYRYAPFNEGRYDTIYKPGTKTTTDNCGLVTGLVNPTLSANGRPTWSGRVNCDIGKPEHSPEHWYDSLWKGANGGVSNTWSPGAYALNAFKCVPVSLTLDPLDGYYKFSSDSYFPLNSFTTLPGGARNVFNETGGNGNNFHFAMHAKASFEYVQGLKFSFKGDDDVWIFINRKLALDLGGQHGPQGNDIDLDKLGLIEGNSYQFDMFYSERHTSGSNLSIKTTMNLVPTVQVVFDTTGSAGTVQRIKVLTVETTNDPSVCPEEGKQTQVKTLPGRSSVYLMHPDGTQEELDSLKYKDVGIVIANLYSEISVDTAKLKTSGLFTQSGIYRVLVNIGTETDSVLFSIVTRNVDSRAVLFDRDGDGRADSVFVHGDGATPAFARPMEAVVSWADASGKTDSVRIPPARLSAGPGDSTLSGTIDPALAFRTSCPPAGCTGAMGRVWGIADNGDTVKNRLVEVQDGIAPVADSAWLVYDTTGTAWDTLYVRASEELAAWLGALPAGDSAYALAGRSGAPRAVPGTGILVSNLLKIPLEPSANPVQPGDSVRLGGRAADASGNAPGAASGRTSKWVPLKAEPVAKSWMLDADGDGRPDSVGIGAKGSLGNVVSARVHWKTSAGQDTVVNVPTPTGIVGGLKLPAGILGNATYCTGCVLDLDLGGRIRTFPLLDSVAPVAIEAKLRFGTAADTLVVTVSEPFVLATSPGEGPAAVKSAGSASISGTLVVGTGSAGAELRIVVASGSVVEDSLRLRGGIVGNLGKVVGVRSRFVRIEYGAQPIVVSVFDRDGDGRADSVDYRLSRSVAGAPVPTGFGLVWGGLTVPVASLARSADGLSWGGPIGPAPLRTLALPGDRGWLVVGTDTTSFRASVSDSVAPVAVAASLVFGYAAGDPDTLRIAVSEPVLVGSTGNWARLAADSGAASGVRLGSSNADQSLVAATGEIQLVVPSGAIADDMLWVRLGSGVVDARGNGVDSSSSRWVRLKLKPSGRASLFDADGDGHADSLRVSVRGSLAATRAVLRWKTRSGAPDARIWPVAPSTGSYGVRAADVAQRFEFGATSCDTCTVSFLDASGDTLVTWPLADSVAPIAVSALYRFGTLQDTLEATFSEPVTGTTATAPWLEWGNVAVGGVVVPSAVKTAGSTATFLLSTANGAVEGWDSVRLAVGPRAGNVTDASGKVVGSASPWAPIVYGVAPFQAWLLDPLGQGRGTHVRVRLARAVPTAAVAALDSFWFAWTDASGAGVESRTATVAALAWDGVSGWTGTLPVPFATGRTGCAAGCVATGIGSDGSRGFALLQDSVPPTAVRARLRYSSTDLALDTLVLDLSEPWIGTGVPAGAFARFGSHATARDLLPVESWSPDRGTTLSLVVTDRLAGEIRRGDSARLASDPAGSWVRDEAGNSVGVESRWVPIEFGLRPPLLDLGPYRAKLVNAADVPGASVWEAPPPSAPQIELLERRADGTFAKLDNSGGGVVDGAPVNDPDRCLGIDIRINRPLEGFLVVYDNLGTVVASVDLSPLKALWDAQPDAEKTIRIQWNATGPDHRFAASGVYLIRVVARFRDSDGRQDLRNLIWKVGFQRGTK